MITKLMKKWSKLRKSKKAFTLIEMIAVVGIISILVAVIQPRIEQARNQAKYAANDLNAKMLTTLLEEYNNDNGYYPDSNSLWGIVDQLSGNLAPYVQQNQWDYDYDGTSDTNRMLVNPWTGKKYVNQTTDITVSTNQIIEAGAIIYHRTVDTNGYEVWIFGRHDASSQAKAYKTIVNRDQSTTAIFLNNL